MNRVTLNGQWNLSRSERAEVLSNTETLSAAVPGCVHTDLLANGVLQDPFYRDVELDQKWVGETDWTYQRTFDVSPDLLAHDRVLLRCYGLDTLATIHINDQEVGRTDNMFRTYEFDVKALLQAGDNTIVVHFAAPMPYVRRMDAEKGEMPGWVEPMRVNSSAWLRKEPCNFGWDWGPKMPTSGIWRDIELVAFDTARLNDVGITQTHTDGHVTLTVALQAERLNESAVTAAVTLSRKGQTLAEAPDLIFDFGTAQTALIVEQPELWWPHGMGEQPLYDLVVTLYNADKIVLDTMTKRIGLRTLTLERPADEIGEGFYFACNGIPFFAKGANWIPASPYPGTTTRDQYEEWVKISADANMNMLRVWGGGIYEHDDFYDLCDQYGITIWQDFMFACGTYPSHDDEFMSNVRQEAYDNVRRLRHHASIALWCGNNEIEQGLPFSTGWLEAMPWENYERLFDHLLAEIVHELAPQTAYWPGSPHSPGDRNNPFNPNYGDTHLWMVWHGKEPFEWYRTRPDRFVSEFGFQSFPEPQTVYEFTEPEDRNITSYVMEHHQRSKIGNGTIIHYMLDWYRLPTSFESMIWLSQILQGMAMKYAVEHWRRNMPITMGTLYWQLNDMWPAPSWASVDWKGNWKALHYMAKRFYAPLMISGLENTEDNSVAIHVTSDKLDDQPITVKWIVTTAQGEVLERGETVTNAAARSDTTVHTLDLSAHVAAKSVRDVLTWLELYTPDGQRVSENLVLLARPKHMPFIHPDVQVEVQSAGGDQFDVTLVAKTPALYTWLELPGARFSDNFVDLLPGRSHTIRVTAPQTMDVSALRAALKVQSLADTYA